MCTISWFHHNSGYDVFFNRDEQVLRPKALPPAVRVFGNVRAIVPTDPQGGGTWIAVNQFGCTFALLNYYQGRMPKGKLLSRGKIIPTLLGASSIDQVAELLRQSNLNKYAPFSLLFFSPATGIGTDIPLFRWTGKALEESNAASPLISSAINYESVLQQRLSLYESMLRSRAEPLSPADFYRLHRSHEPEKSAYSICMHRDDARTVSLSHVSVDRKIAFHYFDGSPCENREAFSVRMNFDLGD